MTNEVSTKMNNYMQNDLKFGQNYITNIVEGPSIVPVLCQFTVYGSDYNDYHEEIGSLQGDILLNTIVSGYYYDKTQLLAIRPAFAMNKLIVLYANGAQHAFKDAKYDIKEFMQDMSKEDKTKWKELLSQFKYKKLSVSKCMIELLFNKQSNFMKYVVGDAR